MRVLLQNVPVTVMRYESFINESIERWSFRAHLKILSVKAFEYESFISESTERGLHGIPLCQIPAPSRQTQSICGERSLLEGLLHRMSRKGRFYVNHMQDRPSIRWITRFSHRKFEVLRRAMNHPSCGSPIKAYASIVLLVSCLLLR
jgi:hypothetical protein